MGIQGLDKEKAKAWFQGWMVTRKGGPGSGHWGHAGGTGGPGHPGGSVPRSSAMSIATGRDWKERQEAARKAGKPIDFLQMDQDERQEVIRNLGPDDVLKMHHGTRYLETAVKLCQEGFDPTEAPKSGRIYAGSLAPEKGYFVSPYQQTSSSFGRYVVEFETPAKNMVGPPEKGLPKGETADDFWREVYPNSFRPALSASLKMGESQGLLTGKVAANKVRGVWRYNQADSKWFFTSRQDFLKEAGGK